MTDLEEAIRQRAYHLWNADGQPEGQAEAYWLNAQREILSTSLEASNRHSAADPSPVTAKPAKAPKAARAAKRKVRAA